MQMIDLPISDPLGLGNKAGKENTTGPLRLSL